MLFRILPPFALYGLGILLMFALLERYVWAVPQLVLFKLPVAVLLLMTLVLRLTAPGTLRRKVELIHGGNLALLSVAAAAQLGWYLVASGEAAAVAAVVLGEQVTAMLCVFLFGRCLRSAAVWIAGGPYLLAAGVSIAAAEMTVEHVLLFSFPLPVLPVLYAVGRIEAKLAFRDFKMRRAAERKRAKLQEELGREELLVRRLEDTREALRKEIEERKEVERGLEQIAAFDELTSVYNRRAGLEVLKEALHYARRNGLYLAVVFMDVDSLKYVNDNYGHAAGDEYLQEVVATLRRHLRKSDSICRFGGDEFVIVLTDCRRQKAVEIFSRIAEELEQSPSRWGLKDLSFSYGTAAVSPEDKESTIDRLISLADERMYIHKQRKNQS